MTPTEAHQELIRAISKSPPTLGRLVGIELEMNSHYPEGADAVGVVVDLAQKLPKKKETQNLWQLSSPSLLAAHEDWAERFGKVAQKLQAGARFAPTEIKGKPVKNDLDPALHNVLADGWHHQPITQPLDTF